MDFSQLITIIPILVSIFSLGISLFVAIRSFYISRPSLELIQTDDAARSLFIQSFDGSQASFSLDFKDNELDDPSIASALLIEIVLINKSSLPLSVLEFQINDDRLPGFQSFTSYSPIPSSFEITTRENSKTIFRNINYIQPEFTLDPYMASRGYILFWSGLETNLQTTDPLDLKIITSRKNFDFKVKYSGSVESIKKYGHISKDGNGNKVIDFY